MIFDDLHELQDVVLEIADYYQISFNKALHYVCTALNYSFVHECLKQEIDYLLAKKLLREEDED